MKYRATLLAILAVAVVSVFLTAMFMATDGHVVPQVVDLYVVLQYARSIGAGHAFHYNPGDPATTGSTSLLYTLVLGLLNKVGVDGEGLVATAIAIGAACYGAAIWLALRIGRRIATESAGSLAAVLVALGGPVVWGFLYGSDLGPFTVLILLLLDRLVVEWESPMPVGIAITACAIALLRPEGLPLALLLGAGLSWSRRQRGRLFGTALLNWLPVAAAAGVLLFNRLLTGQWLGTSLADKSLLSTYSFWDSIALTSDYLVDVLRGLLLGFYPSQVPVGFARGWSSVFFPPLGLLLAGLGYASLGGTKSQAPVRLWLAVTCTVAVLTVPNTYMGVHFHRYILWLLPGLLVLVACGLRAPGRADQRLFRYAALIVIATSGLATLRLAAEYGSLAGSNYRRDYAMARWIRAAMASGELPPRAKIANLATSVEFLSGHEAINLHGVTSAAFMGTRRADREANVFETLAIMPAAARPEFLLTSVATQAAFPSMASLVQEPPLFTTTSLSGDELLLYRMAFEHIGAHLLLQDPESAAATAQLRQVDALNVGEPVSEARHGYVFESRLGDIQINATVPASAIGNDPQPMFDGGRLIFGNESFLVDTAPGKALLIVSRMSRHPEAGITRASGTTRQALEMSRAQVTVVVDGRDVGRWQAALTDSNGWTEVRHVVPAASITSTRTRIVLAGRYSSYQYWFFQ